MSDNQQFSLHRLCFTVEVQTPLELPPWPGHNIRGALLDALRRHYCLFPDDPDPGHSARCPACWLIAREDPSWRWGRTPARPYAIETDGPAFALGQRKEPGDTLSFGVTLFGVALNLLPYLILAVQEMGRMGLGRPLVENRGRRGRFRLQSVEAVHPLTGERQTVLAPGSTTVHTPTLAMTEEEVLAQTQAILASGIRRLRLAFSSPVRITHRKALVKEPHFAPLFARALDRLQALAEQYGSSSPPVPGFPDLDPRTLLKQASEVRLVDRETHWVEVETYSRRTGRKQHASGFVGWAEYEAGDWRPFLPVLLWAVGTHIGKNAVKGDGMVQIVHGACNPPRSAGDAEKIVHEG